jgi:hypothetical protein
MVGLRRAVPLTAQAYVGPSKRRDGWVRRYQPSPMRTLDGPPSRRHNHEGEPSWSTSRGGRAGDIRPFASWSLQQFCSRLSEPHCAD